MPKTRKTLLISATALVIIGTFLALGAYAAAGFNLANLSTVNDWEQTTDTFTTEAESAHTAFVVNSGAYGVRIEPSESDSFEVTSWSNSTRGVEVNETDGTITVESYSKQAMGFMPLPPMQMNFDFLDRATTVKVPVSFTGSITIESGSGNVDVSKLAGLSNLNINLSSGYSTIESIDAADISMRVTSGNIIASNIQAHHVKAFTTSGNLNLTRIQATQTIELETGSGSHHLAALNAPTISTRTTSGSVDASSIDATDVSFDVTSGTINASLGGAATDYLIESSVTSGHLSAPEGSANGKRYLRINVTSGNVAITFNNSLDTFPLSNPKTSTKPSTLTPPAVPTSPEAPAAPTSYAVRTAAA